MKQLIMVCLLLSVFVIPIIGQENFEVQDGELIWQKVFETDLSTDQIQQQLKQKGHFKTESEDDKELHFSIPRSIIDYKGAGYKKFGSPAYLVMNDFQAFALVQIKESKYRVTVKNIVLIKNEDYDTNIDGVNVSLSQAGQMENLKEFAVKKTGEFRNQFKKTGSKVFNYTFNKMFEIKEVGNDDW